MSSSLLRCRVPPGYTIEYDITRVGATTRNRVRKWLEQGYAETWTGEAASLYTFFTDKYSLPSAYIGQRRAGWHYNGAISPDILEVAEVMLRMDAPATTPNPRGRSIGRCMYSHSAEDKPKLKAVMVKLLEDPKLVKKRAAAAAEFDNATKIVRHGQ